LSKSAMLALCSNISSLLVALVKYLKVYPTLTCEQQNSTCSEGPTKVICDRLDGCIGVLLRLILV